MDAPDQAQTSELRELRTELLGAVQHLSARCLYQASKWAAEGLNSLNIPSEMVASTDSTGKVVHTPAPLPPGPGMTDKEILAKTFFDCHEYDRCAYLLRDAQSPVGMFLKLYARYISGEKKKEEEHEGILSPKDGNSPNRQIVTIVKELDEYFLDNEEEPYLLYLHGIGLIHQKNEKEALQRLVRSVTLMPYNWSAWQEIYTCVESVTRLHELIPSLPRHLMTRIFTVYAHQEFFQHDEIDVEELNDILTFMPDFNFLITQKAMIHYHGLEYEESEQEFERVLRADPHRLDDMDTYSNILYVMERRPKLAFLAQLASSTDKFRPETCCIIANYYSLKSEHEKAISYYQRALTLNRNCLSAWTLMGHEFVELKNTHAAIESYRHAIDVNKKDFRAWYGLGQAYEVLDMNYYSLYYYQRAAAIKPMDARMWQALGHCYERLDKNDEAVMTYRRALSLSELYDPGILVRLGFIEEKIGDRERAAQYMRQCLLGPLASAAGTAAGASAGGNGAVGGASEAEPARATDRSATDAGPSRTPAANARRSLGASTAAAKSMGTPPDTLRNDDDSQGDIDNSMVTAGAMLREAAAADAATTPRADHAQAQQSQPPQQQQQAHEYDYEGVAVDDKNAARLWLAKYEMSRGNWRLANEYARGFTHGTPSEMDEARAIVKDTNSRLHGNAAGAPSYGK